MQISDFLYYGSLNTEAEKLEMQNNVTYSDFNTATFLFFQNGFNIPKFQHVKKGSQEIAIREMLEKENFMVVEQPK